MTRRIREAIWRSHLYIRLRRRLGRASRPLRRFEIDVVFRRDLAKPVPETSASVPIEIRPATPEEVAEQAATLKQPPDPELRMLFADRLGRDFVCWTGWIDGELVAYNWMQLTAGEDDGDLVDLREGEAHMCDAFTIERWRGHGIHGAINREMLVYLGEHGYRYAYSRISVTQRRSPKALRALGWAPTGVLARVRASRGTPVLRLRGSTHPWRRLPST
jgi:hypothetical protein